MRNFIIYTDEGLTRSPNGSDVDNCQILGWQEGSDEVDAISTFYNENSEWLEDLDWDYQKCKAAELTPLKN